ncbi:mucin-4-like [Branchiostoma floridae]|uniref:Mucin-4-like n=1 Tax=Branchiostoma floridae TaxID=7739 RepID=A0A9J7MLD4_BRAFL|nr:mucin-4-like [Branchiostoma floridae]
MSDKRNKQDAKRRDKERCRSATTKEGLRKLQELVSQTEDVVNRLADLDVDLVTKATVIASVVRQRGKNGGKSVSPSSKSSLSSEETLQEPSKLNFNSLSDNVGALQDREVSSKVKGNKSYVSLLAVDLENDREDSTSPQKINGNTDTDDSQSQPERQVEENVSAVVNQSKTHFADGNSWEVSQPEIKYLENRSSNSGISSKNGGSDTKVMSPIITTGPSDKDTDESVPDASVSQQCDVTPDTDKQSLDTAGVQSTIPELVRQSSSNSLPLTPSPSSLAYDHMNEDDISVKQPASIQIEGQQDLGDQEDLSHNAEQESVQVCSAIEKAEGIIEERECQEATNSQIVSPPEVDGGSPVPDVLSNQRPPQSQPPVWTHTVNTNQLALQETSTNEQSVSTDPPSIKEERTEEISTNQQPSQEAPPNEKSVSTNAPKTNHQQLPTASPNQHKASKPQTHQQSKSTKAPSTNQKPAPKSPTNEKSAPADSFAANQKPSSSSLTKKKSPSINSLTPMHDGPSKPSTKKQPSTTTALPKIQYPALKKQTQKTRTSTEAQPTNKQSLPKINIRKQSLCSDTLVSNTQPPQNNTSNNVSQSTTSQDVDLPSQSEHVLTNKVTGSPRSPRSSFPIITSEQVSSTMQSNPPSTSISQESPSTKPSNQRLISPTPSNQQRSATPVMTNQQSPSTNTKIQLLSVDQSPSRPSTGSSSITSSNSIPGPSMVKEGSPNGTRQKGGGPESSPVTQRHTSKAKNDVRKKLQGKLRQRRGQRV